MTRHVLSAALLLAACAPTYSTIPAGKTRQEFAADKADCQAKAGAAGASFTANQGAALDQRNATMRLCMEGKGYTEDK